MKSNPIPAGVKHIDFASFVSANQIVEENQSSPKQIDSSLSSAPESRANRGHPSFSMVELSLLDSLEESSSSHLEDKVHDSLKNFRQLQNMQMQWQNIQMQRLQDCRSNAHATQMLESSLKRSLAKAKEDLVKTEADLAQTTQKMAFKIQKMRSDLETRLRSAAGPSACPQQTWPICLWQKDPSGISGSSARLFKQMQEQTWPICLWQKDPSGVPGSSARLFRQMQTQSEPAPFSATWLNPSDCLESNNDPSVRLEDYIQLNRNPAIRSTSDLWIKYTAQTE